ncbi:MAG: hypothetical protein E7396_05435 [Ruminococcaceae bacterium]|nr:hypothetical protein [Oscillospiraceae bacterium]
MKYEEKDISISQEEQIVVFRKLLRQLAMQMFDNTPFDDEYTEIVTRYDKCKKALEEKLTDEDKKLFKEYNELIRERQRYLTPIIYEMYNMYDFRYRNMEKFAIDLGSKLN